MSQSSMNLMRGDFRRFMWYVWIKVLLLPPPTRVQYDIAQFLATGPRRRMVQAFRGVGKSYITAAYIVWRLWRNPDEKVMVVSANEDFAKEISGFIRKILFSCDFLADLRPRSDKGDTSSVYDGFYQLTRLTRDRGSLKHDDRIEILSEAVAHWQEQLRVDQDRAEKLAKDKAMDAEVRRMQAAAGVRLRGGTGRSFTARKRGR